MYLGSSKVQRGGTSAVQSLVASRARHVRDDKASWVPGHCHGRCFSMWVAGGGIKGGMSYGQTDEFAYNIVENPVSVNDLNATLLHCLGIDHERFTVKHQGLDTKLTGVEDAHVIKGILS